MMKCVKTAWKVAFLDPAVEYASHQIGKEFDGEVNEKENEEQTPIDQSELPYHSKALFRRYRDELVMFYTITIIFTVYAVAVSVYRAVSGSNYLLRSVIFYLVFIVLFVVLRTRPLWFGPILFQLLVWISMLLVQYLSFESYGQNESECYTFIVIITAVTYNIFHGATIAFATFHVVSVVFFSLMKEGVFSWTDFHLHQVNGQFTHILWETIATGLLPIAIVLQIKSYIEELTKEKESFDTLVHMTRLAAENIASYDFRGLDDTIEDHEEYVDARLVEVYKTISSNLSMYKQYLPSQIVDGSGKEKENSSSGSEPTMVDLDLPTFDLGDPQHVSHSVSVGALVASFHSPDLPQLEVILAIYNVPPLVENDLQNSISEILSVFQDVDRKCQEHSGQLLDACGDALFVAWGLSSHTCSNKISASSAIHACAMSTQLRSLIPGVSAGIAAGPVFYGAVGTEEARRFWVVCPWIATLEMIGEASRLHETVLTTQGLAKAVSRSFKTRGVDALTSWRVETPVVVYEILKPIGNGEDVDQWMYRVQDTSIDTCDAVTCALHKFMIGHHEEGMALLDQLPYHTRLERSVAVLEKQAMQCQDEEYSRFLAWQGSGRITGDEMQQLQHSASTLIQGLSSQVSLSALRPTRRVTTV